MLPIDDAPAAATATEETETPAPLKAYHATPETQASVETEAPAVSQPDELWNELYGEGFSRTQKISDRYVDEKNIEPNPFQPRYYIPPARVQRLVKSINNNGQIQSALARPHPTRPGFFQLAGGNRRLLAIREGANAGIKEVRPHLYIGKLRIDVRIMTDSEMLDVAFDENEEREDFLVFDRANYYKMVREIESEEAGLVPRKGERFSPVRNATEGKNRGAAETEDGLLSWEALVAIRAEKGKPLPPAKTLRRVVSVLELPDDMIIRMVKINLKGKDAPEDKYEGVTEKHARAVLKLPTTRWRNDLIREIEDNLISGNAAMAWADKKLAEQKRKEEEEQEREKKRLAEEQRLAEQKRLAELEAANAEIPTEAAPVETSAGAAELGQSQIENGAVSNPTSETPAVPEASDVTTRGLTLGAGASAGPAATGGVYANLRPKDDPREMLRWMNPKLADDLAKGTPGYALGKAQDLMEQALLVLQTVAQTDTEDADEQQVVTRLIERNTPEALSKEITRLFEQSGGHVDYREREG